MSRLRRHRSDLLAVALLFSLALLWFSPVLLPPLLGRTLLPYDNLYSFQPWQSLQPGLVPHNNLLSDLVLENAVWKLHIRHALAEGQLPLWNPQIFTGQPFLAAGQASVFYPLSLLFIFLPIDAAYGWFTALQIGLAGANMYLFARVLGLRRLAALLTGLIFMFSGFLIVSVVFTMFVAAVAWLPLILAVIETIIRKQEEKGCTRFTPIPYVTAGAGAIGLMILAGHPELIYYTMLVSGAYAGIRLIGLWGTLKKQKLLTRTVEQTSADAVISTSTSTAPDGSSPLSTVFRLALWLLAMAVFGTALGAIQLIPLLELLPMNFREGSASLAQVRDWAWPSRHILTFALPDIFGNPSHHTWFDIWTRVWNPVTVNARGESADAVFWGIKNYVEGGNYLGIATWILAATGVLTALTKGDAKKEKPSVRPVHVWFFTGLALLSLLFAFGTPLYAVLFYGLPGWDQLHSPFRWVFPFTLSMAVLAGVGLQALLGAIDRREESGAREDPTSPTWRFLPRLFVRLPSLPAILTSLAGIVALAVVASSLFVPDPYIALGQRIVDGSELAQSAFVDGRMFWSYQAANLVRFGLFALLGGLAIRLLSRRWRHTPRIAVALLALIFLDLWIAHGRFNPAAPVELNPLTATGAPPVIQFLNEHEGVAPQDGRDAASLVIPHSPWRFTTFEMPGEKTFNANVGMYYGWHDLRGYDSVIPRQYVAFMEGIAPQENELLYNRIAPLYSDVTGDPYAILDSPQLDLANVKYLLTEHYVPNPSWSEIYRDDGIGVYENLEVLPRVFIAPHAQVVAAGEQPLTAANLRDMVYIEEAPVEENALVPAGGRLADARISRYTANDLFVDVNLRDRGWLVLTDAYFPGWKAFIRPFGADENQEQELRIYRANGAFRTVYLPHDGQWTIRFVYSPMSFKLGLYVSFLAFMTLLLLLLYWAWGKYYRPEATAGDVRTVAKNSLVPMTLSLSNKAIDFAFAMLYVRILGPEGTGNYYFVVALYGFFEIISRYGLGTLLTRDVAADKNHSSRYLTNVMALRTWLWLATMPVLVLVTWVYTNIGAFGILTNAEAIGRQEVVAIGILAIAMLFANWADAFSATFHAFEKMEYPAGLSSAMAILKVTLGASVLLAGFGFVGLAGTSLVVNIVQVIWLYLLLRVTLFRPQWKWDWPLQIQMLRISGPLMINHLLATIFWRIDVWILRPLAGAAAVGLYSIGLKYMDGLNIIPSVFTLAVFPLMSRYAKDDGQSLLRSYRVSVRLLIMVSLPIAMAVTFLAEPLVWLVGGSQYLNVPLTIRAFGRTATVTGGADLAMQVIMWSIPIGFVNSVTQYVLISVNQQHFLTRAFIFGVIFNTVGNLFLIPRFGYLGAAFVTILSELSLLFPFYYSVRRNVGTIPWFRSFAPPAVAVAIMGGIVYGLTGMGVNVWIAVALGLVVYLAGLVLTGALHGPEMAAIAGKLPLGPLRKVVVRGT